MNPRECDALLKMALAEDAARNDITSRSVIPQNSRIKVAILAKELGVLAGIELAARVFKLQDHNLSARTLKKDGSAIKPRQAVLTVEGNTRSIFAAERVALNFLGHLCGIATLTHAYVRQVRGTRAQIFDTRKTLPGLRLLEKYAVRVGGGLSHRMGLHDAVLIKTNHLRALARPPSTVHGPQMIHEAMEHARQVTPKRFIEVEVTDLDEFRAALYARPNAILLDNWPVRNIRQAVLIKKSAIRSSQSAILLEVSGGVTLANVRAIAATGIDRISIGRLTHSAPSLDVSLRVI